MPRPDTSMSACPISQHLECVQSAYNMFYSSNEIFNCFVQCPVECNTVAYNLELSHADFPSPHYAELMLYYASLHQNPTRNFTSYTQLKSSTLAVNVFFDDLTFTQVCVIFLIHLHKHALFM